MKKGERLQYACGHWLVAGEFGIQDDSVQDVPTKRCGPCRDQLRDAAPHLLEVLEWFAKKTDSAAIVAEEWGQAAQIPVNEMRDWCNRAQAVIKLAVRNRDPVE